MVENRENTSFNYCRRMRRRLRQ
ncbi:hypothetical protein SOVF_186830, partial [Spinacia oleracea]